MKNKSSLPFLLLLLIAISAAQINVALSCSSLSTISMENILMSSFEVRCRHQAEKSRGWPLSFFSGPFTNIMEECMEISDFEDYWVLHISQQSLSISLRKISIIRDLSFLCFQTATKHSTKRAEIFRQDLEYLLWRKNCLKVSLGREGTLAVERPSLFNFLIRLISI